MCVLEVEYTFDKVRNALFYTILPFLGAGESGKSTIVKQMK